ncbi:MAG: heme-binding domain-containing protein [Chloroflexota bacterium]
MRKVLKFVIPAIILIFIAIQFVPVDRSNPPVTREVQWDSPETRVLAERACYDCHSNEVKWPWYSYIAPISWRIADHVEHGRRHLNFSTWDQPNEDTNEIMGVTKTGEMPLGDYLLLHPEAQLTNEERGALLEGFLKTFGEDPPLSR